MFRLVGRYLRQHHVALVALFIALGGASYAAFRLPPGSVGTAQLKNNAVTGSKIADRAVTRSKINLRTLGSVPSANHASSADSAKHAVSAHNADHAASADALGGRTPSDFGAVLSGRIDGLTTTGPATDFGSPSGLSTADVTEGNVNMLTPNHALTARDFSVRLTQETGGGQRTFKLVVNGSDTGGLTCGPFGGPVTDTSCNSGSATEVIPANSTLAIEDINSPFPSGPGDARFALRLTP